MMILTTKMIQDTTKKEDTMTILIIKMTLEISITSKIHIIKIVIMTNIKMILTTKMTQESLIITITKSRENITILITKMILETLTSKNNMIQTKVSTIMMTIILKTITISKEIRMIQIYSIYKDNLTQIFMQESRIKTTDNNHK